MAQPHDASQPAEIAIIGVPTALGGHVAGMELTPAGLRELGLIERLQARPGLAGANLRDKCIGGAANALYRALTEP